MRHNKNCPMCIEKGEEWATRVEDRFCGNCGNQLVSFVTPPKFLFVAVTDEIANTGETLNLSNNSANRFAPVNPVQVRLEWDDKLDEDVEVRHDGELLDSGSEFQIEPGQSVSLNLLPLPDPGSITNDRNHRLHIVTDDPRNHKVIVEILITNSPPIPEWLDEDNNQLDPEEVVTIEAEVSKIRSQAEVPTVGRAILKNGGGGILFVQEIEVPIEFRTWFKVSNIGGGGLRAGGSRLIEFQVTPELIPQGKLSEHVPLTMKADGVELHQFNVHVVIHQPRELEVRLPEFQRGENGQFRLTCAPYGRRDFEVQLVNSGTKPLSVSGVNCKSSFLRLYLGGNLRIEGRMLSEPILIHPGRTERAFKLSCNLESLIHGKDYQAEISFFSDAENAEHKIDLVFHVRRKSFDTELYHDSYIGVDFGTSNSCVSVRHAPDVQRGMEEAFRVLALTPESELTGHDPDPQTLPSMIYFREIDDPLIGEAAKSVGLGREGRLFRSFKRTIGMMVEQYVDDTVFTSEDLAEIIFGSLIDAALRDLDHFPTRVVATCPANFYHYQRTSVLRACRRALCRRALRAHGDQVLKSLEILDVNPEVGRPFFEFLVQNQDAKNLVSEVSEKFHEINPDMEFNLTHMADCMFLLLYLSTSRRDLVDFQEERSDASNKIAVKRISRDLVLQFFEGFEAITDLVSFGNSPKSSFVQESEGLELLNTFEDLCFDVLRSLQIADVLVLDEPSAAAYAYVLHEYDRLENLPIGNREYIVVYDFGGGTFDVSVMAIETRNGVPQVDVIHTDGINELGGDDLDHQLIKWVLEQVELPIKTRDLLKTNIYQLDNLIQMKSNSPQEISTLQVNIRRAKKALKDWSEGAKINFSTFSAENLDSEHAHFSLEGLNLEDIDLEFRREDFNNAISGCIEKTINKTREVLEKAVEKEERAGRTFHLDKLVLAGKSSRIPLIRSMILEDPTMGVTEEKIFAGFGKMEKACVARGAAYYGFQQAGGPSVSGDVSVQTVARPLSHTVGFLERRGPREYFSPIEGLEKGTSVGGTIAQGLHICDFKPIKILHVAQNGGNDMRVEGNRDIVRVGTLAWRLLPSNLKLGEEAQVNFYVDRNGIVRVEAIFRDEMIGEFRAAPIGLMDIEPFQFI